MASAPSYFRGPDGQLVPHMPWDPPALEDLRRRLASLQPQWGESREETDLNVELGVAKARLAKAEKGLAIVEGYVGEAEEILRDPLAALEQAKAALTAAEERNARRAAQQRVRRARAKASGVVRRSEVFAILDALQIDVDQDTRDRDRARSDPEYRAWWRDRGALKEGW